jgi:hypothetical protein
MRATDCSAWVRAASVTRMVTAWNMPSQVEADSLYEGVALAVAEFRQGEMMTALPGPMTEFCVTVLRKPIEHRIRLDRVTKWAQPTTRDGPAGITKRQHVRTLLGQAS